MLFNRDKFHLIPYGEREEWETHRIPDTNNMLISRMRNMKDVGILYVGNWPSTSWTKQVFFCLKKMAVWIVRTLTTNEATPMVSLLKALMVSRTEYCRVGTSPFKAGEIIELEDERSFLNSPHWPLSLARTTGDDWNRSDSITRSAGERDLSWFTNARSWKAWILIYSKKRIIHCWHDRQGRSCVIPPLTKYHRF